MTVGTRRRNRDRVLVGGAVALLTAAVAACDARLAPPSPAKASLPEVPPSPSQDAQPSNSPPSSQTAGFLEIQLLDPHHVPNSLRSDNDQLVWSAGESSPSELWRFTPGSPEPVRLFASPRNDSYITSIVASEAGYAFAETSERTFGPGGWRIWFLSGPGADPVEVDRGHAEGAGHPPTTALDEDRLVWASFDEPDGRPVSRLRMASVDALGQVTTLLEAPIQERLLWYPDLNGDELWFGTILGDFDLTGVGDEFHIEMLDLADPEAPPVRFHGTANDFNPVADDRFVVWKTNEPGDAALSWGRLHVLDRATQTERTLPNRFTNRPSLGDRYLAFLDIELSGLPVYDLLEQQVVDVAPSAIGGQVRYGEPSISGRLLAFYHHAESAERARIGWAILPE